PSLSANVGILAAGNGTVTASINPGGTLEIRITDPNLVGNAQVVALSPSPGTGLVPGVAWEGGVTRAVGCVKMALISLPNARIKHVHPHRVTYSDCQGRAAEGGRAADTNAVEVWDIPTNVATPPVRVASQLDVNPRVVDANPGTKRFRALLIGGSFELPRIP